MKLPPSTQLGTNDHNQVLSGFLHVYPVVSRRVGGVSIGINLNLNNACNWRCVYCQVPELKRGAPDEVDVARLEQELAAVLEEVLHGGFMQAHVPEGMRQLRSIAIAGNGEPTLSRQFPQVIAVLRRQLEAFGLLGRLRIVLITNGSMMHRPEVQDALRSIATVGGEAWVKVDRASEASIRLANQIGQDLARTRRQVEMASACCPTWVQTCMFEWQGEPPSEREVADYVELVASFDGILGVLLYGVAREPMLEEGRQVSPVSREWLAALAERLRARGVTVQLSA